jgi:hypothetical protein
MTLHLRTSSWRNTANLLLLPAFTLGALTACSDSTGAGANEPGRVNFVSMPFPEGISPDGKTVLIHDPFSAGGDLYFYDVATHQLALQAQVGSNPADMAHGLSNTGVIAASYSDPIQAGVWSQANGWQVIESQYPGGCDVNIGDAYDVSADGSVVVGMDWNGCETRAFRNSGGITVLLEAVGVAMPGSSSPGSRATVVSDDGSTAGGWATNGFIDRYPAIWAADGSGFTIPTGGVFADDCPGEVLSLSADGSMAGGTWCQHAFYWTQAGGPVDLGRLPDNGDFDNAYANAIAANGQLIFGASGNSFFGTPLKAFVWTAAKGMRPLQEVLAQYFVQIPEGYVLMNVLGASADGTVVYGQATTPDYRQITFIATVPVAAYGL